MRQIIRRIISFCLLLGLCFLCSCEKRSVSSELDPFCYLNTPELIQSNDTFPNLDISDMTVSIPNTQELYQVQLSFDASRTKTDQIVERFFTKVKEHYDLPNLDESSIYYAVDSPEQYLWYPLTTLNDNLGNKRIEFMKYEDDSHFFLYYIHSLAEWFNVPLLQRLIGLKDYTPFGWRPYDLSSSIVDKYDSEDLTREDISYPLLDGPMTLKEAAEISDKIFQPGFCELPAFLDVEPERIEVYQVDDKKYGYYVYGKYLYQGVPLISVPGAVILASNDPHYNEDLAPQDGKFYDFYTSRTHAYILSKEGVCWAWSYCYDNAEIIETYDQVLSLNAALHCLSQMLSEYASMSIDSAELLYASEQVYENEVAYSNGEDYTVTLFPVWEFKINDPGVNSFSELTCYVDAITGTVTLYGLTQ